MSNDRRIASIEEALLYLPDEPIATSRNREWRGVTVDWFAARKNLSFETPAFDHHVLMFVTSGTGRMRQTRAGITDETLISPNMVVIAPHGYEARWEGSAPETIRFRIPLELIKDAAEEMGYKPSHARELLNVFHTVDPTVEYISRIFYRELKSPLHPAQALITGSASCALAAHLLRGYDTIYGQSIKRSAGLSTKVLAHVIAYIEDSKETLVTLDTLSHVAGVSRFHFSRLFKISMGISPMAYVEQSRIRKAQEFILLGKASLAEIALMVGFVDQSHFTRRFQRYTGCTPAAFAQKHGLRRIPPNPEK